MFVGLGTYNTKVPCCIIKFHTYPITSLPNVRLSIYSPVSSFASSDHFTVTFIQDLHIWPVTTFISLHKKL